MSLQNNQHFLLQFQPVSKQTDRLSFPFEKNLAQSLLYGSILCAEIFDYCQEQPFLPEQVEELIALIRPIIQQNQGAFHKIDNSHFVVTFADTGNEAIHATAAVYTAHQLLVILESINKSRLADDLVPFRMGLSVNSGELGNVSNLHDNCFRSNLDGGTIKTAVHLSQLNKYSPVYSAYLGEETIELLCCAEIERKIEKLGDITLQGKSLPEAVYVLF